jgi:predicted CopG family antitoxin
MSTTTVIETKSPKNNRLKKKLHSIMVEDKHYRALAQLGHPPDSFDSVVGRLIQEHYQNTATTAKGGSGSRK